MGFKKNFKYFNRDPHSIVSYGPNIEYKHSLKSYIEGQFFENSQPGFEPATLKSLMKITSAGRGHFELLIPPRGNQQFRGNLLVILGLQVRIQAGKFQKIALQCRISSYVYIQPLGH